MREIKFRAWVDRSEMHTVESIQYNGNDEIVKVEFGEAILWDEETGGHGWSRCLGEDTCILMQYTGLKDKNGVEIYEGDVVLDKCGMSDVAYATGHAGYHPFVYYGGGEVEPEDCQVIGNIYENPELLESNTN